MSIGLCFIIGQLGLGGAEQQLYYLLSGIDRSRFRPGVISLGPEPNEYWEQPLRALDLPLWRLDRSLGRIGRAVRISCLLRDQKIHIVHGWVFHTNPYAALAGKLAAVPVRFGSMRESYEGLPENVLLKWIGYRGLEYFVINSPKAAEHVHRLALTGAEVIVVPNCIQLPNEVDEAERQLLKVKLGFSASDLVIGSIGRLDANKNHQMLLRVFAELLRKWPALRLVIIGDGPVRPELTLFAEKLGINRFVSFPGAIPKAAEYLPAMEVCCLTSYHEGMPNVVMEAAAAGVPVVSTTCGDSVSLIEHQVSGFLVEANDVNGMCSYIDLLLGAPELRRRIGGSARQKMEREHSIKNMISQMTRAYENALCAKGLL